MSYLRAEEELILANFTRRLIDSASVFGVCGSDTSPTTVLNAMRLPAIAIDQHGFVAGVNAAADVVLDNDIKIKDRRLFIRNRDAGTRLKEVIGRLKDLHRLEFVALEPVIVPRMDKLPVIVRILAVGRTIASMAGGACPFDVKCLGVKARADRDNPRQDIPSYASRSETRVHHRAWRSSPYRRPGVEDIPGDGAQSVEIGLCQDGHASPKRTGRAALASRLTVHVS